MHLFSKENIWSNPHSCKYNNSVDRIISKEEEREDPRRDTSIFFEYKYSGVSTNNTRTTRTTVSPHTIQQLILYTELILQEILQLQGSSRVIPCRLLPATVPRVSKHSTWQNKAPGYPTAFQAHTAQAGFQLILPGRNSILSGSQHPRNPYSSSQAHSYKNSTRRKRILSKRVKYCMSMQY